MIINVQKITSYSIATLLLGAFLLLPTRVEAASLYLSPSSGTHDVGGVFSVRVMVDSGGIGINAAEGTLSYNPNELEVLSVSKNNSIFSLWVVEPGVSSPNGTISFAGGTANGFTGSAGNVISVTFKAKSISSSRVSFSTGSVLADDYEGTNVLSSLSSGLYTIRAAEITPTIEEYVPPEDDSSISIITSTTHPESEKWYPNNSPRFFWDTPPGVTGTRLLVDNLRISVPTVLYSEAIQEKQLENLDDGIWYFHVQLRDQDGWGKIFHYKFQIDTQPPKPFKIEVKEGEETTSPQPTLLFNSTDETSGIDYYEIIIDGKEPIKTKNSEYKIPPQDLGKHIVIVRAVDGAGNVTLAMIDIEILPIETPIITHYPKELLSGSIFSIKGTALPETTVKVYIQKDKGSIRIEETMSDKEGAWAFTEVESTEKGVYHIWVESADSFGAKSNPSEKITIFAGPPVFIRIGELAIDYLTTIITLLVLIMSMSFMIFLVWKKINEEKGKISKEVDDAVRASTRTFEALEAEIAEQIAKLDDKPGLSEKEEKIYKDLKKALKISEKFIGKEIGDIKKEIKGKQK